MNFRILFIILVCVIILSATRNWVVSFSVEDDKLYSVGNIVRDTEQSQQFISNERDCVNVCNTYYKENNLSCRYLRPVHVTVTEYVDTYNKNITSLCLCNVGC